MASDPVGPPKVRAEDAARPVSAEARLLDEHALSEQTLSDTDQTASDSDQTTSDTDQSLAESDQVQSDVDQEASDDEQAASDRETEAHPENDDAATDAARETRLDSTAARTRSTVRRAENMFDRYDAATDRDVNARMRDAIAEGRDAAAATRERAAGERWRALGHDPDPFAVGAAASADRTRAAEDRARAAEDRLHAAADRERSLALLREAHTDALTGTYLRAMGTVMMDNEIARARRTNTPLILAFVDVDDLKGVNDRDGHEAGDALLRHVGTALRAATRSYDPVMRFGGDEFVCTIVGIDEAGAAERFTEVQASLATQHHASISVGFAMLGPDDTLEELMSRADAVLQTVKRSRTERVH